MQFIYHQIAQRIRLLLHPQRCISGANQQKIQHFVVSQQNIRRIFSQCLSIGDDGIAAVLQPRHRL
ncbi:hypothetical protein D3C80_1264820 [compost metagenome]